MATDSRDIEIVLKAKDEASGTLSRVGGAFSDMGGIARKALNVGVAAAAGAAVAGIGALTAAGISSVKSFQESELAGAQLEAVLKSTKGAAGLLKEELDDQAAALQKMTMFSDEAVGSAQSLLLTFTNVKGPVFKDSITTILDMSQALGQDLKSSAIQVGKALNDPINGITALSRVGVSFTEQQKEQITTLVESGKTMEAQNLILKELQVEFGGAAKAAGGTFAGQMTILTNQVDNFKERIGMALVQGLMPFFNRITAFLNSPEGQKMMDDITASVDRFTKYLVDHQDQIFTFFKVLGEIMRGVWTVVKAIAGAFNDVAAAIANAIVKFEMFKEKMQSGGGVTGKVKGFFGNLADNFRAEGGPVTGGTPYVVGERGPELFVPRVGGTIVPNNQVSGSNISINFNGGVMLDSSERVQQLAEAIGQVIGRQGLMVANGQY